jgi:hypothetical protein
MVKVADLATEKEELASGRRGMGEGEVSPVRLPVEGRRRRISNSKVCSVSLRWTEPHSEKLMGQVDAQNVFHFSRGIGNLFLAQGRRTVRGSSHGRRFVSQCRVRDSLEGEGECGGAMAVWPRGGRRGNVAGPGHGGGVPLLGPRAWPPVSSAVQLGAKPQRPFLSGEPRAAPRGPQGRGFFEQGGRDRDGFRGQGYMSQGRGAGGRGVLGAISARPQGGSLAGGRGGRGVLVGKGMRWRQRRRMTW